MPILIFLILKGPINGGTKITILGTNLGQSFADVRDTVRVANAKCDVSEPEYVPSRRMVFYILYHNVQI